MQRHRGFTLIELVVTLAILGVLAWLTVPVAEVTRQRVKEQELRHALREMRDAIDAYKRAVDEGDIEPLVDGSGYPPTLDALVDGVPIRNDQRGRKMYFLRRIPRDPMNDQPGLSDAATWARRSFYSEPTDPREGDDVFDVYSTSGKVGLNGIPYRQW